MRVRAAALGAVALVAGCGGDDEPGRTLAPGTLTVGLVVESLRDREIVNAAQIAAGEVNDVGGIEGEVRLELVIGGDARALAERGAGVIVLPCESLAEQQALEAVRGRRVLTLTTCANTPPPTDDRLTTPWGVGPDIRDRAALLAEVLRDRDLERVRLLVDDAAPTVRSALEAGGVDVVAVGADAVVTDAGWERVAALGSSPAYGLDRRDSAGAIEAAGAIAEGGAFATFGYPSPGTELDELFEKHRLEHGRRPDGSHAALGYNAVLVAVEAVERSDSTDPAALGQAMPGLTVAGATGILNFDEEGSRRPRADAAVVEVREARLELVRRGRPERD